MKDLLAVSNAGVMAKLGASNTLLAFDYDGTLAPIVAGSASAPMRQTTWALFTEVSRLYPCLIFPQRDGTPRRRRRRAGCLAGVLNIREREARLHVADLVPPPGARKGAALEALVERLGFESVLYVGDDDNDEGVFSMCHPSWVATRVGRNARSDARYFIHTQRCMDILLARLLSMRRLVQPVSRPYGITNNVVSFESHCHGRGRR
jgi:hypothetical protein